MERACRLCNTTHWDVTPSLPLPSLPASCGARGQRLLLSEDPGGGEAGSVDRVEILGNARKIADLLKDCDVSYLNIREDKKTRGEPTQPSWLYSEVLKYNPEAFEYEAPGSIKQRNSIPESKPFEQNGFAFDHRQKVHMETPNSHMERTLVSVSSQDVSYWFRIVSQYLLHAN